MSDPIQWWKTDPDYYPIGHPERKGHLQRLKENLKIDKLIRMSSSDQSYSLTLK